MVFASICGSSASNAYGSGGSVWATMSSSEANDLTNGQHPIERDLRPVLLLVGHHDAVVHSAFDQSFENPEQVIRRHAEHRRTQAPELIERQHSFLRRDALRKPVHQMNFCPDGPYRPGRAVGDLSDDVFGRAAVVSSLHDLPRDFGMHDHANAGMLLAD